MCDDDDEDVEDIDEPPPAQQTASNMSRMGVTPKCLMRWSGTSGNMLKVSISFSQALEISSSVLPLRILDMTRRTSLVLRISTSLLSVRSKSSSSN